MITSFLPSKKKSYNYSEITDTPTSLPANGGNADTLGNKYSAADLDSMPKSSEVEDYTEIEPPIMDADILGSKYTADDIDEIVNDLDTHRTNTAIHITSEEKSSWNAKGTYSKPTDGIPKSDLSSDIQTSLGKADTALQEHQDISGKQDSTDSTLETTSKTIVGAINEVNSSVNALEYVPSDLARNGYGSESGGRNIFNTNSIMYGSYSNNTYTFPYAAGVLLFSIPFKENTQYTFSGYAKNSISGTNVRMKLFYTDGSYELILVNASTTESYKTFTSASGKTIKEVLSDYGSSASGSAYSIRNFQIEEGTTATTYEPYYESNKMLTEDVNEIASLKYLGWTVPREMPIKNVDKSNSMTQRVGRVDLGTLSWVYNSNNSFYATLPNECAGTNGYISGYIQKSLGDYASTDKTFAFRVQSATSKSLYIHNTSYTDATAFRSAMSGVYLYYELGTSVEIAEGHEALSTQEVALGNGEATAYKSGNVVTINVDLFNGLVIASGSTIGTLPVGWRPKKQMFSACACGSLSNIVGRLYANSDGVVGVASNTETYYARGSITFIV